MRDDIHNLTDALADLLDREHRALLTGGLDTLSRIADEKEALVPRLARMQAGGADLTGLRRMSERNAVLLNSARAGVRAARQRLGDLSAGPKPLQTYGPTGARVAVDAAPGSFERRA